MARRSVAVVFGGRTPEHEVSILTAHEAIAVLKAMDDVVVPVYITKDGRWLTGAVLNDLDKFADPAQLERECRPLTLTPMGDPALAAARSGLLAKPEALAVDVALPVIHGPNGEDGTLQGTLEMLGIPYAGSGVLASALCMDKVATKHVLTAAGLPQVPFVVVTRAAWDAGRAAALGPVEALGDAPLFVKPVRGGSSIGVTFVEDRAGLESAVELALTFDREAVVETAVVGATEVNCAVLRSPDGSVSASVLERVQASEGFLTYEQKYMQWSKGGGAKAAPAKAAPAKGGGMSGHQIPAGLPDAVTARVQDDAKRAFEACGCDGVARVDFLLAGDDVFVNEINTLPGSLAFYLWEASGVPFDTLLDTMLESGIARADARGSLLYTLDRNLLAEIEKAKGAKRPRG